MTLISKEDALEFLKSHHVMTLATVSEDGTPHATALLYVIDDDFSMYFVSHAESHKVKNVMQNNLVSLAVWEHKKMSVQVNGEARLMEDQKTIDEVLTRIAEAGAGEEDHFYPPIFKIRGQEYSLFKIHPMRVRCLDLRSDQINVPETPFIDIQI